MFKCKECGLEYNTKPDYCDCGNDEFIEIAQAPQNDNYNQSRSNYKSEYIEDEEKEEISRLKKKFDPAATSIMLILIVIGLIIFFFVGNPKEESAVESEKQQGQTAQTTVKIPSIDSIWNDSTVGIINNEKTNSKKNNQYQQQKNELQTREVQSDLEREMLAVRQKLQSQAPQQQPVIPTTIVPNQSNNNQKPKMTSAQTQKPVQNTVSKQTQTTQGKTSNQKQNGRPKDPMSNSSIWGFSTGTSNSNIPKTTQAIANQPKSNTQTTQPKPTKPSTTQTVTKTNTQVSKPSTTQKVSSLPVNSSLRPKATVDTQALKKELADYKIKLRNLIGRKIDFANVVGDGDCAISFKVASNGKLVNRAFAKQSSNITLNDAVYKAVMATPSYNPPPSGYNNETMVLKIRFYNGNFDISLN